MKMGKINKMILRESAWFESRGMKPMDFKRHGTQNDLLNRWRSKLQFNLDARDACKTPRSHSSIHRQGYIEALMFCLTELDMFVFETKADNTPKDETDLKELNRQARVINDQVMKGRRK